MVEALRNGGSLGLSVKIALSEDVGRQIEPPWFHVRGRVSWELPSASQAISYYPDHLQHGRVPHSDAWVSILLLQ